MVNRSTAYKNADITGIAQTCSKWEPASHSKETFLKKEVIKCLKLLLVIGMADLPASRPIIFPLRILINCHRVEESGCLSQCHF